MPASGMMVGPAVLSLRRFPSAQVESEICLVLGRDLVFTFGPYSSLYTRNYHPATNTLVMLSSLYLALSYDHRIIDGREAVLGLVTMKETLEDPSRLLLDL